MKYEAFQGETDKRKARSHSARVRGATIVRSEHWGIIMEYRARSPEIDPAIAFDYLAFHINADREDPSAAGHPPSVCSELAVNLQ
jgi:hypothetical protein